MGVDLWEANKRVFAAVISLAKIYMESGLKTCPFRHSFTKSLERYGFLRKAQKMLFLFIESLFVNHNLTYFPFFSFFFLLSFSLRSSMLSC